VPLAGQLVHQRCVRPGPLVLGTTPLNSPTPTADRDRQFCYSRPCRSPAGRGPGHFCLTLHVAMQFGLYLPAAYPLVRRTVSEDSSQGLAWLAFPADCPHRSHCHCPRGASSAGYSEFPAYSQIYRQQRSTVSRRSEPSSRTALMGEQPNPWDRLQPQDATSRHRGAKPGRRCGLLGPISLLSPEYLLSVERRRFHLLPPDH
jgi:hypothetical protein